MSCGVPPAREAARCSVWRGSPSTPSAAYGLCVVRRGLPLARWCGGAEPGGVLAGGTGREDVHPVVRDLYLDVIALGTGMFTGGDHDQFDVTDVHVQFR